MKLVYQNFDKLELSFKGNFPKETLAALKEAKERAQKNRREEVAAVIGIGNVKVMVAPNGAQGGYAYRFNTGESGEIWSVKDDLRANEWNIRVSVRSLNLALNGFETVKKRLFESLNRFGAYLPPRIDPHTGTKTADFEETIGRVDYCFDFLSDDFILDSNHLVTHSHTKVETHEEPVKDDKRRVYRQGNRVTTLTVGCMPNKQLQIYDKTREISEKRKDIWHNIWGIKPFKGQRIWRVEVRFGKEALANRLNIRTFKAVEAKFAKAIKAHMLRTRYTLLPRNEQNPSRMDIAPFWQVCIDATDKCFEFETSEELQNTVRERLLELKKEVYKGLVIGNVVSFASLEALDFDEVPECFEELTKDIHREFSLDSGKYEKRFKKALEKHSLL